MRIAATLSTLALATAVHLHYASPADACGCFTPPDPSVPIVQAGERIIFQVKEGVVTAHIQVQYSGPAEEFGWLLPLPSVPEMELGTDEVFAQIVTTTQPRYTLDREFEGSCGFGGRGVPGLNDASEGSGDPSPDADDGNNTLVIRDTVGPYDFAVLRADSKQPMLDWLRDNRFFVPTGTEDIVDAYIRPGAYFLALKLRKGNEVGDLQPVVLKYESDLPMIPIILTSVAADPDMGIQVWVLGEHRAIPRNYYHTVINDAAIDWLNFGENYVDVVTKAVDESNTHQSFVTEYAGTSSVMQNILDYEGRYGSIEDLKARTDAADFVQYLIRNGYGIFNNAPPFFGGVQLGTQLLNLLQRDLPVPAGLLDAGITANDYYSNMTWYLGRYREQNPELYDDLDVVFDPDVLANDIHERVVEPTLGAGKLFRDNPYMTRLFTTLSPDEMTRDPVFSFNPELPDVANEHRGRLIYYCDLDGPLDNQGTTPAMLITEQGWKLWMPGGTDNNPWGDVEMPYSSYTQVMREEGPPENVGDRTADIDDQLASDGGCGVGASPANLLLLFGCLVFCARRRFAHSA